MKFALIASLVLSVNALSVHAQTGGHTVQGNVSGHPDSTWIFLKIATDLKPVDSCQVQDGIFKLSGKLSNQAEKAILFTANYKNYLIFWLENNLIHLTLKAQKFKNAVITGSLTQDQESKLSETLYPLNLSIDSLTARLKAMSALQDRRHVGLAVDSLKRRRKFLEISFVKNNPGSLVAADMLNIYATTWGKDTTTALFSGLDQVVKNSRYGKEIAAFITLNRSVKVGDNYVDFEQTSASGASVRLSNNLGKYTLIDFWAAWCFPCRAENPNLVRLYKKYKHKGFEIIGVSLDNSRENWLRAIKDDKLPWQNLSDLRGDKNKVALIYGISKIPDNYLIGKNGETVARDFDGDELENLLEKLL